MTRSTLFTRRHTLAIGIASIVAPQFAQAKTTKAPVLVELFTSQGCSSCPPADKLAAALKKRSDVIVLSYNVDYWDYLGWRDTLAKPEFSQRQYDYARTRGDGNVYTPQMVFNGSTHAVGSQKSAVEAAITASEAAATQRQIEMQIEMQERNIVVNIPAHDKKLEATLWLLAVAEKKSVVIERGENSGKTITYHNVVRNMVPAAMWNGEAYSGKWMREAVLLPDCTHCVAVLQLGKTGKLLAVAQS